MMERRAFLGTLTGGLLAAPLAAEAQQATTVARIGLLSSGSVNSPEAQVMLNAFQQELRELGYIQGQNIVVEYRAAEGEMGRLPSLASDLARLKVDLIVAAATPAARAAQRATSTLPIVAVAAMGDPIADGLVASLARPGGNVTGNTFLGPELVPKRLELLKEALPRVSRVAALWHPGAYGERTMTDMLKETETVARTLSMHLQFVGVRGPDEFARAFSTMTRGRPDALIMLPSPMLFGERKRIVELAAKYRLPTMYNNRESVQLGGLIAYGTSLSDLYRRAAVYVGKILKGAKPGDLPVEQPTKFELVINLKTAKALGLTIPPALLQRADQVIE
jgi:putative ABC transport system substrate-binding protein